MIGPPPMSPLFPNTTLSQSDRRFNVRAVAIGDERIRPAGRGLDVVEILPRARRDDPPVDEVVNPWKLRLHRSEEHTSELQSRQYLVCRLLLEKKKIAGLDQI